MLPVEYLVQQFHRAAVPLVEVLHPRWRHNDQIPQAQPERRVKVRLRSRTVVPVVVDQGRIMGILYHRTVLFMQRGLVFIAGFHRWLTPSKLARPAELQIQRADVGFHFWSTGSYWTRDLGLA